VFARPIAQDFRKRMEPVRDSMLPLSAIRGRRERDAVAMVLSETPAWNLVDPVTP